MSLARVWKDFDLDRDITLFHSVPCRIVASVLSTGVFWEEGRGDPSHHPGKGSLFWQGPWESRETAYLIMPRQRVLEMAETGGFRITYSTEPDGRGHYTLSHRPETDERPNRMDAGGSLLCLPEDCDAGVGLGFIENAELSYFAFTVEGGDLSLHTAEAVRTVVARARADAYVELRHLLRGDNEAFERNLSHVADHLPAEVKNMRGIPQLPGHYGLDPVEHTIEALKESAKSQTLMERFQGQWEVCREWVRCALVYHDLGKKVNPFNARHAKLSGKMARFHLRCMGYDERGEHVIVRLLETHDMLGGVKRGRLSKEEGAELLCRGMETLVPLDVLLDMHYEVAAADIRSIGYLRQVSVQDEYLAMRQVIRSRHEKATQ